MEDQNSVKIGLSAFIRVSWTEKRRKFFISHENANIRASLNTAKRCNPEWASGMKFKNAEEEEEDFFTALTSAKLIKKDWTCVPSRAEYNYFGLQHAFL